MHTWGSGSSLPYRARSHPCCKAPPSRAELRARRVGHERLMGRKSANQATDNRRWIPPLVRSIPVFSHFRKNSRKIYENKDFRFENTTGCIQGHSGRGHGGQRGGGRSHAGQAPGNDASYARAPSRGVWAYIAKERKRTAPSEGAAVDWSMVRIEGRCGRCL